MKTFLISLICTVCAMGAYGQHNLTINGRLQDAQEGMEVQLLTAGEHRKGTVVARATVSNGTFVLQADLQEPRLFNIHFPQTKGYVRLMAAPGEEIIMTGLMADAAFQNAPTNDLFLQKNSWREEVARRRAEIEAQYKETTDQYNAVVRTNDKEAVKKFEQSEAWLEYNRAQKQMFALFDEGMAKAVGENADTFWGPLLMLANTAYFTSEMEETYDLLTDAAKETYYGRIATQNLFGIVGKAPDFSLADRDGKMHTLGEVLESHDYVLIDFWASWCGPCRRFQPQLRELAAKYADKGLVVVGISLDYTKEAWVKALDQEQMPWLNLWDEGSAIKKQYGVEGIPSFYLIEKGFKVRFSRQGSKNAVEKLERIFGK